MSETVQNPVTLEALDLAALIASKVCHDLISPIGAIGNGLELLAEGTDEETADMARDLIRSSAQSASARLRFCRIAFGAAGSAGSEIDTRDAQAVATDFCADCKTKVDWLLPAAYMPKNQVKLLLNLVVMGLAGIPRGGAIKVEPLAEAAAAGFLLTVTGLNARVPPHATQLLAGVPTNDNGSIDAHAVQPFYTGLLARAAGMNVAIEKIEDAVVIRAG